MRNATFLILFVCAAAAQDPRGTVLGHVSDPSGAVIAWAAVRATNLATGVSATANSNQAGGFNLPYLLPGEYRIEAELAGFKRFVREGVQVRVADVVEVNIAMEIGQLSESVEVKAETPLLSTAEASLGQVIDQRRILELPSFGGSPMSLGLLAPGTLNGADLRLRKTSAVGANSEFATDGGGYRNNEFTIDGVSNTRANGTDSIVAYIPPQTAVTEFKVQTSSFDASVGHTVGALVNVSTKSGTNELHGEAHWWVRNRVFDAPNLFQNRSGQKVPVYQDNRYGASAGGPVRIPRLYDGRNKTFFFYAWEGNKFGIPQTFLSTVPKDNWRRGDLSDLLKLGSSYQVYDPFTTTAEPNGQFRRQPIPNNAIPASRLDPVATKIMEYWPRPNQAGTSEGRNNWYYSRPARDDTWTMLGRADHAFSPNHRVFVRVHRDYWREDRARTFANDMAGVIAMRKNYGASIDDVVVLSPAFLMNLRYGLTYQPYTEQRTSSGFDLATLGFAPRLLGLVEKSLSAFPNVQVSPMGQLSSGNDGVATTTTHSFSANFTRMKSNHIVRFGAEFRAYRENRNYYTNDNTPQLVFSTSYTRGPLNTSPAPTVGGELASFLLGVPGGSMTRTGSYAEQDTHLGLYVQDDYKVSRRLTLNLGVRFELESPITERYNRSVAGFGFATPNPLEAQARANYAKAPVPELPPAAFRVLGGVTFAGVGGNPRGYWKGEKNNFMPRFGFAYQLFPKTILRGGYGIFFDTIGVNRNSSIQLGFSQSTPIQTTLDSGLTYVARTADPFPNGLLAPAGASGGLMTNIGQSLSFFRATRLQPYNQKWSLGVQQALPWQFLADVSYVGNRGTRLSVSRSINNTPEQYLSRLPYRDQQTINYLSQSFPSPFSGLNPIFGANTSRAGILRPYPHFGSISVDDPVGYSWYHSLQARGEKRLARGFTFQVGYTWSKTMDATDFLNATDLMPYEAISTMDRTHRFTMSGIWEIPVGRKRRFGARMPGALDFVLGGWQLNGVVQRQSGPALGWGDVWTLFTGNPNDVKLSKDERNVDRWFNTGAGFNRNSTQQLGSNIRVSPTRFSGLRADGQARWDFSAIKTFRVSERVRTEFRAECLNAWNHPNLFAPNTAPTSSTFGTITTQDVPRVWQLALKVGW